MCRSSGLCISTIEHRWHRVLGEPIPQRAVCGNLLETYSHLCATLRVQAARDDRHRLSLFRSNRSRERPIRWHGDGRL
jgi:hypothetical protein